MDLLCHWTLQSWLQYLWHLQFSLLYAIAPCDALPRSICVNRIPAHYVYPQAFMQPSMVIPHVQQTAATATAAAAASSQYLDYTGAAYAQYSAAATAAAAAAAYDQYPYAASPAPTSYMAGYGYAMQQPLATAATPGAAAAAAAFGQYQPQTDRMQ